tara:strand:+ start:278 stop:1471 length:1194 start_codon:yes stop_codon:yes gene_type:complete
METNISKIQTTKKRDYGSGSIHKYKTKGKKGFRIYWRDDLGKKYSKVVVTDSKKVALNELRKCMDNQIVSFIESDIKTTTFKGYATLWLQVKKGQIAISTYYEYLRTFESPTGGLFHDPIATKSMKTIVPSDINRIINIWITKGTIRQAEKVYSLLHAIFNQAVKEEVISKNPVSVVTKPKTKKPEKKSMSIEEWGKFIEVAKEDSWMSTFFRTAVISGLRRSEMCGLRVGDINIETGYISLQRGYVVRNGQGFYTDTKNHRSANIPVDKDTLDLIKDHIENLKSLAKDFDRKLNIDSPLFPNVKEVGLSDAKPINPDTWTNLFKRVCKKAKLDREYDLHELRHTTASILIVHLKKDPVTVSKRLRHHSVGFTLDQYTHLFENAQKDSSDELGSILS